jgi:hypothetical protein
LTQRGANAAILILRRQFLAEPRHCPIELMQVEPVDAGDAVVVRAPAIRRAVGAADEQPVQHSEEHCWFQGEAVFARACELHDRRLAAGLGPQPLKQQRRSDAATGDLNRVIRQCRERHRLGLSLTGSGRSTIQSARRVIRQSAT